MIYSHIRKYIRSETSTFDKIPKTIFQAGFIFWRDKGSDHHRATLAESLPPPTKIQLKHLGISFAILITGILASLIVFARELCKYKY